MKRTLWITLAALLAGAAAASAQTSYNRDMGGMLIDRDIMTPADLIGLSQTQFNFGTARAMAMAGAFTSLGADVSSMAINPAGLGMYRKSEVTLTPMMTFSRSSTPDAGAYGKNGTNRFSVSNFGVVVNAVNRTHGLIGLSFGFGYNRIADFNYDYSYQRSGQAATVADLFARQLMWDKVSKESFRDNNGLGQWNWDRIEPQHWNAALAYRAYMIDQTGDNEWAPTWIGNNADITHYNTVKSRGSAGEYALSVGANIENKFYIGATLGIQSIHQKLYVDYAEDYRYADPSAEHPYGTDPSLDYQLLYARLNQAMIVQGTGVNFKIGVVYRPVAGLRIGAAFHTPTYYSLDRKFQSSAASMAYANSNSDPETVHPDDKGYIPSGTADMTTPLLYDENPDGWSFSSPARLLLGASYTFGNRAVISVDYERDWYNGIRMKGNPIGQGLEASYRNTFRDLLQGSNIVRAGAEFKALPGLALRAGFGYSGSMLRKGTVMAQPVVEQTLYYGAGIGFALSRVCTLDVAYQHMKHTTADYYLFYVAETIDSPEGPQQMFAESSTYRTEFARHNVALTLSFRF